MNAPDARLPCQPEKKPKIIDCNSQPQFALSVGAFREAIGDFRNFLVLADGENFHKYLEALRIQVHVGNHGAPHREAP